MTLPDGIAGGKRVEFARPPVVEVALAAKFEPLAGLGVVGLGTLWERGFKERFPHVQEQPRYEMPTEALEGGPTLGTLSFQVSGTPPLPRLWFLDGTGAHLVQVQSDWLARNWRKVADQTDYPRFGPMREEFQEAFGALAEHMRAIGEEPPVPTQVELTYINHISTADGNPPELAEVLTVVRSVDHAIGNPESTRFVATYSMEHGGARVGRMHISATPAVRRADRVSIIDLTLTLRGRPLEPTLMGAIGFLDLASERALEAFGAITTEAMHESWGMK